MAELFLDTAYAVALSSPPDPHHQKARELARRIETQNARLVTTRAVVLEIGNALAKQRYRAAAVALLRAIENDPVIEVVPLSEELYDRAMRLYGERLRQQLDLRRHGRGRRGRGEAVAPTSRHLAQPTRYVYRPFD